LKVEVWTIQKLLSLVTEYLSKKSNDSLHLNAGLLLPKILALRTIELHTQNEKTFAEEQLASLQSLFERASLAHRRKAHPPVHSLPTNDGQNLHLGSTCS
jgi:hypothetical protein